MASTIKKNQSKDENHHIYPNEIYQNKEKKQEKDLLNLNKQNNDFNNNFNEVYHERNEKKSKKSEKKCCFFLCCSTTKQQKSNINLNKLIENKNKFIEKNEKQKANYQEKIKTKNMDNTNNLNNEKNADNKNNSNQAEIKEENKDHKDNLNQEEIKEAKIDNNSNINHEEIKEENIDNKNALSQERLIEKTFEKKNSEAHLGSKITISNKLAFFSDQIAAITPNNFESFMIQLYNVKSQENVYAHKFNNLIEALKYDTKYEFKFWSSLLPFIFQLASESFERINLQNILKKQENREITFSKYQIAGIMAQLFFGLIPNRKEANLQETVNFLNLFTRPNDLKVQKLLCILNYFKNIKKLEENQKEKLQEVVTYSRKVEYQIKSSKNWHASNEKLLRYEIISQGTMEEQQYDKAILVDFANKLVGGGVLKSGTVQEEIMFMICPECIPSLYFFEEFEDNEVGFILGVDRINQIQGYKKNFQFKGDFAEILSNPKNKSQEIVIAILDALDFNEVQSPEFAAGNLQRELNKAFLAFSSYEDFQNVITGKWGCGIFGGTPILKFLIQWIAASECGKSMKFCTMNDLNFQKDEVILEKIWNSGKDVGSLSQLIYGYAKFSNKFSFPDYLTNNL